jgi:hypothetical protein
LYQKATHEGALNMPKTPKMPQQEKVIVFIPLRIRKTLSGKRYRTNAIGQTQLWLALNKDDKFTFKSKISVNRSNITLFILILY